MSWKGERGEKYPTFYGRGFAVRWMNIANITKPKSWNGKYRGARAHARRSPVQGGAKPGIFPRTPANFRELPRTPCELPRTPCELPRTPANTPKFGPVQVDHGVEYVLAKATSGVRSGCGRGAVGIRSGCGRRPTSAVPSRAGRSFLQQHAPLDVDRLDVRLGFARCGPLGFQFRAPSSPDAEPGRRAS